MNRSFLLIVLAALSFGTSASAQACLTTGLTIRDVTLHADGALTRTMLVHRDSDAQNGEAPGVKLMPVIRDKVLLMNGDELVLNASPTTVDATFLVKVSAKAQDRDEKGIFSTTFHVVETSIASFGGIKQRPVKKAYLAKVKSNYLGNGAYSRGCSEVEKTILDLESSSDVR